MPEAAVIGWIQTAVLIAGGFAGGDDHGCRTIDDGAAVIVPDFDEIMP